MKEKSQKLNGGWLLECGHTQVVSMERIGHVLNGRDQRPVWCIECDDYTTLNPIVTVQDSDDAIPQN